MLSEVIFSLTPILMRFSLVILIFIGLSFSLSAQDFHRKNEVSASILKKYDKARDYAQIGELDKAMDLYSFCIKKDPLFFDAIYKMGLLNASQGQFQEAKDCFSACEKLSSTYRKDLSLNIALVNMELKEFNEAVTYFERYLDLNPRNENQIKQVNKMIIDASFLSSVGLDLPFDPRPIAAFNSPQDEYFPSISILEDEFVFTRRVYVGDKVNEDFFRSVKDDNNDWTEAVSFDEMNTALDEGARSVSADGRTVFVTYCNQEGAMGSCDLYESSLENGKWSAYRNVGSPINTSSWESQPSISANGDKLIFCSNRAGGKGAKDLWMAERGKDGKWGKVVNLGDVINTERDEKTPFLHADGRTLYFMSDGHPGFGSYDLFLSRLDDEGNWSEPVNLGSPINTKGDEGLLIVNFSGDTGYFASDRDDLIEGRKAARPNYDIYAFDLYRDHRPSKAVFVRGKVLDAKTGKAIEGANLSLTDIRREDSQVLKKTEKDGAFLYVLEDKREYGLFAEAEGYLFASINFNLLDFDLKNEDGIEVLLEPITELVSERATILENVFFKSGSAQLESRSEEELNRLADMVIGKALQIKISGHTDDVGSSEDNLILSEARAKAVVDYLINRGVPAQDLQYEGRGEEEPIADNNTEAGRRKNRRTSFSLLSN